MIICFEGTKYHLLTLPPNLELKLLNIKCGNASDTVP
jgi:hypothetical protein